MNPQDPSQPQVDPMAPAAGVPGAVPPTPVADPMAPPAVPPTPVAEPEPVATPVEPVATPEPVVPPAEEQPEEGQMPPTVPPAV